MDRIWWRLPGPGKFADTLAMDLMRGINHVVTTPQPLPEGLRGAVLELLEGHRHTVNPLEFDGGDTTSTDPLDWLRSQLGLEGIHDVADLASHRHFQAQVTWIDGIPAEMWPHWRQLLERYAQQARDHQEHERGTFCLLIATPALTLKQDLLLRHLPWQQRVRPLDMALYVAQHLGDSALDPQKHLLRQELIAVIAGSDPALALALIDQPLEVLLDPATLGTQLPDGNHLEPEELSGRIWLAQVRCLFPLLEERRQAVLSRWASKLTTAYHCHRNDLTSVAERPDDYKALGLGELSYLLTRSIGASHHWTRYVGQLKRIRNHLAHQQPVPEPLLEPLFRDMPS